MAVWKCWQCFVRRSHFTLVLSRVSQHQLSTAVSRCFAGWFCTVVRDKRIGSTGNKHKKCTETPLLLVNAVVVRKAVSLTLRALCAWRTAQIKCTNSGPTTIAARHCDGRTCQVACPLCTTSSQAAMLQCEFSRLEAEVALVVKEKQCGFYIAICFFIAWRSLVVRGRALRCSAAFAKSDMDVSILSKMWLAWSLHWCAVQRADAKGFALIQIVPTWRKSIHRIGASIAAINVWEQLKLLSRVWLGWMSVGKTMIALSARPFQVRPYGCRVQTRPRCTAVAAGVIGRMAKHEARSLIGQTLWFWRGATVAANITKMVGQVSSSATKHHSMLHTSSSHSSSDRMGAVFRVTRSAAIYRMVAICVEAELMVLVWRGWHAQSCRSAQSSKSPFGRLDPASGIAPLKWHHEPPAATLSPLKCPSSNLRMTSPDVVRCGKASDEGFSRRLDGILHWELNLRCFIHWAAYVAAKNAYN